MRPSIQMSHATLKTSKTTWTPFLKRRLGQISMTNYAYDEWIWMAFLVATSNWRIHSAHDLGYHFLNNGIHNHSYCNIYIYIYIYIIAIWGPYLFLTKKHQPGATFLHFPPSQGESHHGSLPLLEGRSQLLPRSTATEGHGVTAAGHRYFLARFT